jgi:phenylpropionate dioxygenase-like ring-hydroxylating dioxygenase large terminal subunit
MQSRIPPQAYIDQAWFERERDLLFKPLWQFVGLKVMLDEHNAFITRNLFGIPIVVQNFHGELRAFENVCPHRQNPIQTAPHGVRSLTCGYHGWKFDREGAPAVIPLEAELYRYPEEERACLHLRRFALECVGNLVFVNVSPEPMPIKQQLGAATIATLTQSSLAYDCEVVTTTYETRFNWKLIYENLRDAHHPLFLHPHTLNKFARFDAIVNEDALAGVRQMREHGIPDKARALALLRSFSGGGRDTPLDPVIRKPWYDEVLRYRDQDWYYNWLVYPNLHIASIDGGHSFIVEHHVPVAAGRTDMTVYYLTAKKKQPYASSPAVLHELMMHIDGILREDITVLEQVQRTLHPQAGPAHLGSYEYINAGIEQWYMDLMEGKIAL